MVVNDLGHQGDLLGDLLQRHLLRGWREVRRIDQQVELAIQRGLRLFMTSLLSSFFLASPCHCSVVACLLIHFVLCAHRQVACILHRVLFAKTDVFNSPFCVGHDQVARKNAPVTIWMSPPLGVCAKSNMVNGTMTLSASAVALR